MTDHKTTEKLLTTKEAAEYLGVHEHSIRNWVGNGRLVSVAEKGARTRPVAYQFRLSDLDKLKAGDAKPDA